MTENTFYFLQMIEHRDVLSSKSKLEKGIQ